MLQVLLNWLQPQAKAIIAEEQADFRAGWSTTEQICNLCILSEKYLQHQQELHHVFIEFKEHLIWFGTMLYALPWGSFMKGTI